MLLACWPSPLLALLGVPLRARLICVLALIALYVPVTGAGPSIQRAGIMGATGVVAALAGRPRSRWYARRCSRRSSPWPQPPRERRHRLAAQLRGRDRDPAVGLAVARPPARAGGLAAAGGAPLAEGAGGDDLGDLATAPLMASALRRGLDRLAARQPPGPARGGADDVAGDAGLHRRARCPAIPVEPLTWLAGLLAAYVAQVAHWLGSPAWARLDVRARGAPAVAWPPTWRSGWGCRWRWPGWPAARAAGIPARLEGGRSPRPRSLCSASGSLRCLGPGPDPARPAPGLRVTVLDVGQGDAILLDPLDGDPVLVDGGPPGDELRAKLERNGVSRIAAAVVTHDQADHVGGIEELLGALPIHRLLYAEPSRDFLGAARGPRASARGRSPRGRASTRGAFSCRSCGRLARCSTARRPTIPTARRWCWSRGGTGFSILLTADAEAEAVPIDPGPVDVLKVAHHGSDDAGLGPLLDRISPRLAVISVGDDNPYGHPTPETISTLAEHRVPTLRTDSDGEVTIDVTRRGWSASAGD